ncbi:MAG: hypothetical protein ACFFD4_01670 [Candidatus Odinarchaeota archaeon]
MKKRFAAILLVTVFLSCCQIALVTGSTASLEKSGSTRKTTSFTDKILLISKNIKNPILTLGEDVLIEITIVNTGDSVLYDVNVTDTVFEPWSFTIRGITSLAYNQIDPGQTIIHIYAMTPKKAGNYTSKSAVVTYYAQPSNIGERLEYQSRSNAATFSVSEATEVDELPLMLLNIFSAVAIVYTLFVVANTFSTWKGKKKAATLLEELEKE